MVTLAVHVSSKLGAKSINRFRTNDFLLAKKFKALSKASRRKVCRWSGSVCSNSYTYMPQRNAHVAERQ